MYSPVCVSRSEVVAGEEHLLVNLKVLFFLMNLIISHISEMQLSKRKAS